MPIKLIHTSDSLLKKEFSKKGAGYDSFEVDSVLDDMIKDYRTVEANKLLSEEEYQRLLDEIASLKKDNINLKIALDSEKGKMKYIKKDGKDIHIDNLVLLERIGKLEQIIHDKLHINPDEIINFDPDDC